MTSAVVNITLILQDFITTLLLSIGISIIIVNYSFIFLSKKHQKLNYNLIITNFTFKFILPI